MTAGQAEGLMVPGEVGVQRVQEPDQKGMVGHNDPTSTEEMRPVIKGGGRVLIGSAASAPTSTDCAGKTAHTCRCRLHVAHT